MDSDGVGWPIALDEVCKTKRPAFGELDPKEIMLGTVTRESEEKSAFAKTDLNFDWIGVSENLCPSWWWSGKVGERDAHTRTLFPISEIR
jgi:hypothetical protein